MCQSEADVAFSRIGREFEIPPGFESVKGSGAVTRESVLLGDKELWFFKLPKHVRVFPITPRTLTEESIGPL